MLLKTRSRNAIWLAAILSGTFAGADICSTLEAHNDNVEGGSTIAYETELQNYWSAACSDLRPACMVFPSSTQEVSDIVTALQFTDDKFAIKSGGHMPNNGFASIQGGVLISTKNLNDRVVYDSEAQTALVGPGLTWAEAQKALEGTGRAVVGGRLGGVGIGGYVLGGGLSFLSSQYGWTANTVVDFEVVLANGTAVHANNKSNTDLFMALKGGGNNFGIVTAYTLQTYPISDQNWGGLWTFTDDKTPQVLEAIRNFVEYYPDDKAAIIPTCQRTALFTAWFIFVFYDGSTPPSGVFDNFTSIGPTIDTSKTWDSYYDLLQENDNYDLHGQRYAIGTETTPLPNNTVGADVLKTYFDVWYNTIEDVLSVSGLIGTIAFQPMSRTITSKAKANGGDLLDFPTDTDYIIFEVDISHFFGSDDDRVEAAIQTLYSGLDNHVQNFTSYGYLPDVYRPLFMNDAHGSENYWGRIRTREMAQITRKAYDPEEFFQERTSGGFRLG